MIKISLEGAEFFARHGYYPEEKILGNRFVVNIDAEFTPRSKFVDDNLDNTLNYEQLYRITLLEMKTPRQLLETVAQGIIDRLIIQFSYIDRLSVNVRKLHPPLGGTVAASGVTIVYQKAV